MNLGITTGPTSLRRLTRSLPELPPGTSSGKYSEPAMGDKMGSRLIASGLLAALLSVQFQAVAQSPPLGGTRVAATQRGEVTAIEGPEGAVVVVRGSQAYALLLGDILFEGDRVFTRANGRVTLQAGGCEQTLEPAASITVDEDVCEAAPVMVAEVAEAILTPALAGEVAGTVGANPALLATLAGGGGAAAALGGGGGSSPAQVVP